MISRAVVGLFALCGAVASAQPSVLDGGTSGAGTEAPVASTLDTSPDAGAAVDPELAELQGALEADTRANAAAQEPPPNPVAAAIQSLNPDISFIADVAAAWFSHREPLQTGGHDPTQRGFNLQQLELAVSSSVDPYFRFASNIVFSQFGVEVEEVYASTLALPYGLQARVGQFLTQFGRLNATHPHSWQFADQPFALGRVFGGENNRGLGAEVSWISPLPWYLEVVGSATDPSGESTARSFFGGSGFRTEHPLDFQFTGAVKQFFDLTDTWSFLVGVSAANGPNGTGFRNRTDVYGVDLYFKYRPVSSADPTQLGIQSEWIYRRRQVPSDLLSDVNGYLYAFWRFDPRWGVAARYEYGSPSWSQDGELATDPLDPDWSGARQRVSANVTFWPTEFSRIRLQTAADLIPWRPEPDLSVFLAFEFSVGAHGAHSF